MTVDFSKWGLTSPPESEDDRWQWQGEVFGLILERIEDVREHLETLNGETERQQDIIDDLKPRLDKVETGHQQCFFRHLQGWWKLSIAIVSSLTVMFGAVFLGIRLARAIGWI